MTQYNFHKAPVFKRFMLAFPHCPHASLLLLHFMSKSLTQNAASMPSATWAAPVSVHLGLQQQQQQQLSSFAVTMWREQTEVLGEEAWEKEMWWRWQTWGWDLRSKWWGSSGESGESAIRVTEGWMWAYGWILRAIQLLSRQTVCALKQNKYNWFLSDYLKGHSGAVG